MRSLLFKEAQEKRIIKIQEGRGEVTASSDTRCPLIHQE